MRILEKILDNYYKKKVIAYVKSEVQRKYFLDCKVVEYKDGQVDIQFKPKHYMYYTSILKFHKGDSLNWLIELRNPASNFILKLIDKIDEDNLWDRK